MSGECAIVPYGHDDWQEWDDEWQGGDEEECAEGEYAIVPYGEDVSAQVVDDPSSRAHPENWHCGAGPA